VRGSPNFSLWFFDPLILTFSLREKE